MKFVFNFSLWIRLCIDNVIVYFGIYAGGLKMNGMVFSSLCPVTGTQDATLLYFVERSWNVFIVNCRLVGITKITKVNNIKGFGFRDIASCPTEFLMFDLAGRKKWCTR